MINSQSTFLADGNSPILVLLLGATGLLGIPLHGATAETGQDHSYIRMSASEFATATLHSAAPGARVAHQDRWLEAQLQLTSGDSQEPGTLAVNVAHRYRALEFSGIKPPPAFNGDLHALGAGVHWRETTDQHRRQVSITPVVAVSSNALKNPDALSGEALQLRFSWSEFRRRSSGSEWLLGIGVDDRLGNYGAYPIVGVTWQPRPTTSLQLAFPDSLFSQRVASALTVKASVSPDGGQWRVYDKSMTKQSDFNWEAWRLSLGLEWTHRSGLAAELRAGTLSRQHMRMVLENDSTLDSDLDSTAFASLTVDWRWP